MYVDVESTRRHVDKQKADRLPTDHQQPAVSFRQCVLNRFVLKPATVQKQVLPLAVRLALTGMSDVAGHTNVAGFALNPDQVIGDALAVEHLQPIDQSIRRRQVEDNLVVVPQYQVQTRIGQRHSSELVADVSELG